MKQYTLGAILAVTVLLMQGCETTKTVREQAEEVAKDWNFTIRAAGVIPVYPMSADLRPGDVFLSRTPVNAEADLWEERGYIPIEAHLLRLPVDYDDFYGSQAGTELEGLEKAKLYGRNNPAWVDTILEPDAPPIVGFPSYSFRASFETGLAGAVPIQGVPVALSFLNVKDASANLSISDASSYGIDVAQLHKTLVDWAGDNADLLNSYVPIDPDAEPAYLRVVYRIYRAKQFDIGMYNVSGTGITSSIGAKKEVPTATLQRKSQPPAEGDGDDDQGAGDQEADNQSAITTEHRTFRADYDELLKSLSNNANDEPSQRPDVGDLAEAQLPGASVQFTSAAERSVSFKQTFTTPIVVGYHAFDVEIRYGGKVGAPMSTLERIDGSTPVLVNFDWDPDKTSKIITDWLNEKDERGNTANLDEMTRWLKQYMKPVPPVTDFVNDPKFYRARLRAIEVFNIETEKGGDNG